MLHLSLSEPVDRFDLDRLDTGLDEVDSSSSWHSGSEHLLELFVRHVSELIDSGGIGLVSLSVVRVNLHEVGLEDFSSGGVHVI